MKKVAKNFQGEESGNIAIMSAFGIGAMVVVGTAVLDYTYVSSTDDRSQTIADAIALSAAIYVNKKGHKPASKADGLLGTYTADQLGYDFSSIIVGGSQGVTIEIIYDDVNGVARAIVSGASTPTFKGVIGKGSLPFRAEATVSYGFSETKRPASIALVLDTSGSMMWDDKLDVDASNDENETVSGTPGAQSRNASLISVAKDFMTTLKNYESDSGDPRVVRTGLYAYETYYSSSRSSPLDWKTLPTDSSSKLHNLPASGGTNAADAMEEVSKDMALEDNIHYLENGENDPLKFVVLMTDGANNYTQTSNCRYEYLPSHKHWEYKYKKEYWDWSWNKGWYKKSYNKTVIEESRFEPQYKPWDDNDWRNNDWVHKNAGNNQETEYVCDVSSSYDQSLLDECTKLAADDIKIHTVGFGLEPGYYHMRDNYSYDYDKTTDGYIYERYHIYIDQSTTDQAYTVLQQCASISGGNFYAATDAAQLNSAFVDIGASISADVVRLTN